MQILWQTKFRNRIAVILSFCILIFLLAAQCSGSLVSKSTDPVITTGYGLIYYSQRNNLDDLPTGGFGGLYFADLNIGEEIYLTKDEVVSQFEAFSWSPVTRRLIYTVSGEDPTDESSLELYSLDLNGNKLRLTHNDVDDSNGRWRPDGQKIAFWSARQIEESFLYLMDPDGSNVQPILVSNDETIIGPEFVWSPDSKKLAISTANPMTMKAENVQIVELDPLKILPLLPILPNNRIRTNFNWSYDSQKLVYLSDPVEVNTLFTVHTTMYVYDLKNQTETVVAKFEVIGTPVWSPINDVIAFSAAKSGETGDLNIYLVNGDGTELKQMTNGGAYRVSAWSLDGTKLAIEAIGEQLNDHEIYTFDITTRTLERVTNNDVLDAFPIWVEP